MARSSAILHLSLPWIAACCISFRCSLPESERQPKGSPEELSLVKKKAKNFKHSWNGSFCLFHLLSLFRKKRHGLFTLTVLKSGTRACCLRLTDVFHCLALKNPYVLFFCSLKVVIIRDPILACHCTKQHFSVLASKGSSVEGHITQMINATNRNFVPTSLVQMNMQLAS